MFKKIILCLFLLSTAAIADTLPPPVPALYAVHGVSSDDTLNVRLTPDARGDILGELAHNANGIEVVGFSFEGNWAKIIFFEQTGWVSTNYIQAEPRKTGMPEFLRCFGTEPFWFVRIIGNRLMLDDMELSVVTSEHTILYSSPSPEFLDLAKTGMLFNWQSGGRTVTSRIVRGQCSDGMSDQSYALHYYDDADRSGCCSITE